MKHAETNHWSNGDIEKFSVQGFFYKTDALVFRKYLEIRRIGVDSTENDLNVIMMNPGSSKPRNMIYKKGCFADFADFADFDKLVDAEPDSTIVQIMRVMENCGLDYAKIVNLSNIRARSLEVFLEMLKNVLRRIDHSVFTEEGKPFLKDYLNPKAVFIFAWGVDRGLQGLAKQAIEILNSLWGKTIEAIGIKHSKNKYGYYHPLPWLEAKRIEWVNKITEQIMSQKAGPKVAK